MNKSELVKAVAKSTGIKQADVSKVIDIMLTEIASQLDSGNSVSLNDFGVFSAIDKPARTISKGFGRDGLVEIAASKSPKFKAYSGFKDAVNSK
mgnify:FL=1